jgi:hypothetical protein
MKFTPLHRTALYCTQYCSTVHSTVVQYTVHVRPKMEYSQQTVRNNAYKILSKVWLPES